MEQSTLRRLYRQAPASSVLAGLCVLVYLVTALESRSLVSNLRSSWIADRWILFLPDMIGHPVGIGRVVGYALLHNGPSHLLMNVLMLYLFGRELERFTGRWMLAAMFLMGAVGSAAVIVWENPLSATVGASGALYAFMAIAVGMSLRARAEIKPLVVLIVLNLGFTLLVPGISLFGHLGGLAFGAVLGAAIAFGASWKTTWLVILGETAIAVGLVVVAML
ncbi:Rhomboid family protein [Corynebacterium choanae]|uniref:Rhomboid family protein n=2 Tax=Corynebacterium choanae TaxID=1862358 RepID=A0A3G6J343_9CORY|nr:Rhomboid family protein [Corynebacterium choanae]